VSARLVDADVRAALRLCGQLPAATDPQSLRRMTVRAVSGLVRCEAVCWYDWSPLERRLALTTAPAELGTPEFLAAVAGTLPKNPIALRLARLPTAPPLTISDFFGLRELRRTAIYANVYSRMGVTRELAVGAPAQAGLICLSIYRRGRDYSQRDRARVELLRPPLITAVRLLSERVPVPSGLTARESEVLAALTTGATPSQIALELQVSLGTVRKHLEHIYRKLGVTHQGAAVARTLGIG
jgi:DNA-binding CsgD family transcriptional regulator